MINYTFLLSLILIISTESFKTFTHSFHYNRRNSVKPFARKNEGKSGKGFAVEKVISKQSSGAESASSEVVDTSSTKGIATPVFLDENDVFKKYGISEENSKKAEQSKAKSTVDKAFGESVLEKIPAELQLRIDNILVTLTFGALLFVVLSGVGISLGALKVVFPSFEISEESDAIIKNFLTPAFTPALGIFLLFSTTFGLYKFAQISSSQTVYKE